MRLFLVYILLLFAAKTSAAEKVIIEGDDDYAPYSFIENGQYKGIYVDFLKLAAEKLAPDYLLELRPVPWKRGLKSIENGRVLALFPPYLNKDRRYIQAYSVPIYRERVVLFCREDMISASRKVFPKDFYGLLIGVNLGFTLGDKMVAAVKSGRLSIEEVKGNDTNIKKLLMGRIACYANDRLSVIYSLKKWKNTFEASKIKLIEAAEISEEDAFIAYGSEYKWPEKEDFILKMNMAIEELKKTGIISKMINEYTQ
ncbi:substrate-binding periplasmic protein [Iodobacter violaceini]|uniref:substrate-binding periplasmic protein n=1 Tax=Iodobacter violaceini TaxID=3044271 RepID=UPI00197BE3B8|nr:transporter substrate-binding domain-containing protein [Iodobacter violacea]